METKAKNSNKSAKILVADDSLTIQKVIKLALAAEGYDIQTAADAQDTLQNLNVFRPQVVLIDVSLPGKNAFEIKRTVNEQNDLSETRFILMSSAFEKVDEAQASEVVFHGRLTKPFDPSVLRKVVGEVLSSVQAARTEPTAFIQRPSDLAGLAGQSQGDLLEGMHPTDVPPPIVDIVAAPPPIPGSSMAGASLPPPLEGPENAPGFAPELPQFSPPGFQQSSSANPPPLPAAGSAPTSFGGIELDLSAPPPLDPSIVSDQDQTNAPMETGPSAIPPPPIGSAPDTDIKILTESTIQMSGLDEMAWSIREPERIQQPPEPTPRQSYQSDLRVSEASRALGVGGASVLKGRNTFRLDPQTDAGDGGEASHHFGGEMPPFNPERAQSIDPAGGGIRLDQPAMNSPRESTQERLNWSAGLSSTPAADEPPRMLPSDQSAWQNVGHSAGQLGADSITLPMTPHQIEEMVSREVEARLKKMAQGLLPDIAERIVKQEIHRILSEEL